MNDPHTPQPSGLPSDAPKAPDLWAQAASENAAKRTTAEPAWERVMNARKEDRPQARDYMEKLFHGVFEVQGDQCMGNDEAIITAIA